MVSLTVTVTIVTGYQPDSEYESGVWQVYGCTLRDRPAALSRWFPPSQGIVLRALAFQHHDLLGGPQP